MYLDTNIDVDVHADTHAFGQEYITNKLSKTVEMLQQQKDELNRRLEVEQHVSSDRMCLCVCVRFYVFLYVIYRYTCVHTYTNVCVWACTHLYVNACAHAFSYHPIHPCMYKHIYVHTHILVFMYTCISLSPNSITKVSSCACWTENSSVLRL